MVKFRNKIRRTGNSLGVVIPSNILKTYFPGYKIGDIVELDIDEVREKIKTAVYGISARNYNLLRYFNI